VFVAVVMGVIMLLVRAVLKPLCMLVIVAVFVIVRMAVTVVVLVSVFVFVWHIRSYFSAHPISLVPVAYCLFASHGHSFHDLPLLVGHLHDR
jgi:hypothetical protein